MKWNTLSLSLRVASRATQVTSIALALILASCGGSGSNGSAPRISNLIYTPLSAFLNDGDGSLILNGSITFNEPDGDISRYVLTVFDSNFNEITNLSNPIPGIVGVTSGNLLISLLINTTVVSDYNFEIYLTDLENNVSNTLSGIFPIIGPTHTSSNIPDTGVSKCFNQSGVINCPLLESQPHYGQDYHYSSNPMSFTDNGDGTIKDNVTSLTWQMDHDGQLYNWYEAMGTFDTISNPTTIDVCGNLTVGGHKDWRLPRKRELGSIVDYGVVNPAIDTVYFPNTNVFNYWSSTAIDPQNAWYGRFSDGSIIPGDKTFRHHLRCVRGDIWGENTFTDNGDGTVTDTGSGLTWQKTGQGSSNNWEDMLGICTELNLAGHSDWRLANIKELETIVGAEAALDILPGIYCSSSTIVDETNSVWMIQFAPNSNYGDIFRHGAGNSKHFCGSFYSRCVR